MALRASAMSWRSQRGTPHQLMRGLAEWTASTSANAPNVSPVRGEQSGADPARKTFQPWWNNETGHWQPPKYSLRRQSKLMHAAFLTGAEDLVRASPKYARYARRAAEMEQHELVTGFPTVTWPQLSAKEDAMEAKRIAQTYNTHGPYTGRSNVRMFKGHKHERASQERRARVAENMRTMHDTIAEWRKEKAAARAKEKPISPL